MQRNDAERTATVRRFGAMFLAGARLTTSLCTVVLRKCYGLGAMAMASGSLHAPRRLAFSMALGVDRVAAGVQRGLEQRPT